MHVDVLLGLQWGDEGKGKIVDYLAPQYDIVARFQGGPNAGHTLVFNNNKHVLHTIPSGIFREQTQNVIGNGVVVDPVVFSEELEGIEKEGVNAKHNLFISKKAHLILPTHRILDEASETRKGNSKIGSTLRGIGPAYMDKTGRNGLRVGDIMNPGFKKKYNALKDKHFELLELYGFEFELEKKEETWFESIEVLKQQNLINSHYFLNEQLNEGKKILAEGAQGSMLDIDFGTYPFVTSSNTISSGACNGLGIAPTKIKEVFGISKAYCTRVGSGPFPTELEDETGEKLRKEGGEFGATTGRPRRCGWLDLPALKYTAMINGLTQLIITKIDVLNSFETIDVCTDYKIEGNRTGELPFDIDATTITPIYKSMNGWNENIESIQSFDDLPASLRSYISFLEKELGTAVSMISTGPGREQLINKQLSMKLA